MSSVNQKGNSSEVNNLKRISKSATCNIPQENGKKIQTALDQNKLEIETAKYYRQGKQTYDA